MLLKALNKAFAIYAFIYAFIYAIIYAFKSLSKGRPSKYLDAKAVCHPGQLLQHTYTRHLTSDLSKPFARANEEHT